RIVRGEETFEVEVAAIGDQRGPATKARTMYVESEASRVARENRLAALRAARAGYQPPQGKPDKRARRLIRALGDIDATSGGRPGRALSWMRPLPRTFAASSQGSGLAADGRSLAVLAMTRSGNAAGAEARG